MWQKRRRPTEESERVISDPAKARERTMNRAVRLLAAKPRSIGELRERLLEKSWTNREIVDAIIETLSEYSYLDDQKYAADLAVSKLRQRPQGRRRLKQTLSQKKLDKETVDEAINSAFETIPETELIDRAIEKQIRLKGIPKTREEVKKFYDHLLRRGFGYDLIIARMKELAIFKTEE
jgi:SOS response regulatory protein OraA/RecX